MFSYFYSASYLGMLAGALIAVIFISWLFRQAFFKGEITRLEACSAILASGIIAFGFYTLNTGGIGYIYQERTDLFNASAYIVASLILCLFVMIRKRSPKGTSSSYTKGKIAALLIALPLIAVCIFNVFANVRHYINNGLPGYSLSEVQIRSNMLNGDMGEFWRTVEELAPAEFNEVVENMSPGDGGYKSIDEANQRLNSEIALLRHSVAVYSPYLTDSERSDIIRIYLRANEMLSSDIDACARFSVGGGIALSQSELLMIKSEINDLGIKSFTFLLTAKASLSNSTASNIRESTEEDYQQLFDQMKTQGISSESLSAYFNDQASQEEICAISTEYYRAALGLKGEVGVIIRRDIVDVLLSG